MGHRIVLTGGGTGGHVYPALAVAEQLKRDASVQGLLYIGAKGHVEERLAKQNKIEFVGLKVSGLPRKISFQLITWPVEFMMSVLGAMEVFRIFRPTAVLGTGGYASAPPLMAAMILGIPFAVHEPDAHPGLTNRMFGKYASLISLGMDGAQEGFAHSSSKIQLNGNPVSERFAKTPSRKQASKSLGIDPNHVTLLVTGGSQGAQAINRAVYGSLPDLIACEPTIQIIHQVGEKNWQELESTVDVAYRNNPLYKPTRYIEDLALAYAASDLTVCRAGAMTIAELCATATPAIFIPLPGAAQDHQTFNAASVESTGGAALLKQSELGEGRLQALVRKLIFDREKLDEMRKAMRAAAKPKAASALAEQLKAISSVARQS